MKENFDKETLEKLSDEVLTIAQQHGASSAEVDVSIEAGFTVNARMGDVETLEYHHNKAMGITVYFDKKIGSASSTDFSRESIRSIVEKACNFAKYAGSDPCNGLADADLMAHDYESLDLYFPWTISTDEAVQKMIACENIARQSDKRITNSEGASLSTFRSVSLYANTHGFVGSFLSTEHSFNCVLIAEKDGQMQRDYDYTIARDPKDLDSIEVLADKAVKKTVQRIGARKIKTTTVPVIYYRTVAKGLLSHFATAVSGSHLYRKSSFLLDHLDKKVFPEHISILQDPHVAKALGSSPFDAEGVATSKREIIENGFLKSYFLNTYSARKLGMKSTGNAGGIQNLYINHEDYDLSQLMKKMHRGLLVTEVIGQGVDLVTGNYSRGAFGYWIENGEIQYPVEEVTISGNLKDMLQNIIAVANDVDHRSRIHTGSILIDHMMIAGD